ncbi:MAG: carbohydrate binding domain-containing protein [Candidatus Peribacteraceae bacterium]|nr:carbohydrate binding domain-containing protein [Candidatus Peribacteraceae bacterium]MDD5742978.1 carbohydrate binding domain-containing protein [Candidatus Peribacteraceae bacterium]
MALAVTRTWDGGGGTNNWSEDANWSADTEPTGADAAVFDATSAKDATVDADILIGGLTVTSGYGGTLSLGSSVITGTVGDGAVQFTAADKSWLQIADASQTELDPGTSDFAISFWYKPTTTGQQILMGKGENSSSSSTYRLQLVGAKLFAQFTDNTHSLSSQAFNTSFTAGQWYFVVANFQRAGNLTMYVNGVAEASTLDISDKQGSMNNASPFEIGSAAGTFPVDGAMDSFSYLNRVLTADEITWLYNAGNGRVYKDIGIAGTNGSGLKTNLVSWWDLGENAGTRYDSYGTNHLSQTFDNIIAPPVYGSEKLGNTGFETVTSLGPPANFGTWSENPGDGNIEVETNAIHGGTNAVKLTSGATSNGYIYQASIAVTAGASYRLSFWTRGDGTNAGQVAATYYDGSNKTLITKDSTGITGTTYSLVTYNVTIPTGGTHTTIILWQPAVNGGVAYYDDVSLKQITTASINNGGFEDWTVPDMGNKVTNSGFDSDTTGWTALSSSLASVAGGYSGNALQITNEADLYGKATQSFSTTVSAIYKVSFWHKNGSHAGGVRIGTTSGNNDIQSDTTYSDADWTLRTFYFTATTTTTYLSAVLEHSVTGDTTLFDNIEVIQLPSNADTWTESFSGTSRIVREDDAPYSGTNAARLDVDASNSNVAVYQPALTLKKLYTYSFYAKAASGTPTLRAGGYDALATRTTYTLTTSYVSYGTTYRNTPAMPFGIWSSSATSNSIYLDSITLTAAEILGTTGVPRGQGSGVDYAGQFNGTSQSLSITDTDFNPGTGDFTVGASFYVDKTSVTRTIFYGGPSWGNAADYFWVYVNTNNYMAQD